MISPARDRRRNCRSFRHDSRGFRTRSSRHVELPELRVPQRAGSYLRRPAHPQFHAFPRGGMGGCQRGLMSMRSGNLCGMKFTGVVAVLVMVLATAAIAVAPGVWTPKAYGVTKANALDSGVLDGYRGWVSAYEQKFLDGAQMGGTCW